MITILRHYIDRAYSAKTDNRPEFQDMIKDSGKRLFDMVIVWKLDRFARNRYDSARYKATLKKNGVKVVSATEVISEGAEGIILESVLEGYAEYYSADLSEKVIRGRTENALKCKFNGGTLPIGYVVDEDQRFQTAPLTAPFVLEVFKKYDQGATMKELRDWPNENGTRNRLGKVLNYNSVQHMLKNRRYIGEYQYRDILVPDGIPEIIPHDLFDRLQEKTEKNRKAPARHKAGDDYLLTTKLLCGYCGAYLCGESGKSRGQMPPALPLRYNLLDFDGGADSLELSLQSHCVFLGDAFLDLCGNGFDHCLCLGKAQTGDTADLLDDLDLLCAEAGHDNVKLGLLFNSGTGSDSGAGSNSSSGNTEGVLQSMYELAELKNGKAFDLFDHGSDFFTHCIILH